MVLETPELGSLCLDLLLGCGVTYDRTAWVFAGENGARGRGENIRERRFREGGFAYREKSRIALQQQELCSSISNYPTMLLQSPTYQLRFLPSLN
jgi:hypothetical protein